MKAAWRRPGGARERAIDFPPLKPQFIILRDTRYRSAAFSLFVILATQRRSQRRILFGATCSRDEGWRHQRTCRGDLILFAASVSEVSQQRYVPWSLEERHIEEGILLRWRGDQPLLPGGGRPRRAAARHVAQFLDKAANPCTNDLPLLRVSLFPNGRYKSLGTSPQEAAQLKHFLLWDNPIKTSAPPTR